MEASLAGQARAYMAEINALTVAEARPWTAAPAIAGAPELAAAGYGFPADYPGFGRAA
jgi:hypothetical protein